MTGADKQTEKYKEWWLEKTISFDGVPGFPKKVTDVEFVGPPSAVYGVALFSFEDGSKKIVSSNSFKPRKKDITIVE